MFLNCNRVVEVRRLELGGRIWVLGFFIVLGCLVSIEKEFR